jgi:hypothetical protein
MSDQIPKKRKGWSSYKTSRGWVTFKNKKEGVEK